MAFPHYKNKHKKEPVIHPSYFVKGKMKYKTAVFVYTRTLLKFLIKFLDAKFMPYSRNKFNSFGLYESKKYKLLIVHLPIGSPVTSVATDELIASGVKRFIIFGFAGSLRDDIPYGNIVLCSKSLRDEGSSYHYVGPGTYAYPTKLKDKVESIMRKEGIKFYVGPSWTIDTPYMETKEEVEYYAKKGILTVEMESSSMFSVVNRRNHEGYRLEAVAIFIISDLVTKSKDEYTFIRFPAHYKKYNIKDRVFEIANVIKKLQK